MTNSLQKWPVLAPQGLQSSQTPHLLCLAGIGIPLLSLYSSAQWFLIASFKNAKNGLKKRNIVPNPAKPFGWNGTYKPFLVVF